MENHHLDELAKAMASEAIPRRRALRLLGVALLGGVLGFPGVAEARKGKTKKTCPPGYVRVCKPKKGRRSGKICKCEFVGLPPSPPPVFTGQPTPCSPGQ